MGRIVSSSAEKINVGLVVLDAQQTKRLVTQGLGPQGPR